MVGGGESVYLTIESVQQMNYMNDYLIYGFPRH